MIDINEIKNIAKKAGEDALRYYDTDYDISYKSGDNSPLTEADLASEKIILAGLEKFGYPILSEESVDDKKRLDSEYVWVVDPLDGTSDFVQKTDEFAVMIGLVQNNHPILGVIFEPVTGRFYFAEKGRGAFSEQNGEVKKLAVSPLNNFSLFRMLVSRNHLLPDEIKLFEEMRMKEKVTLGSAGLKLCRIASGEAEVYVNSSDKTSEWDTCAGKIILEEAGGKLTDLLGNEPKYNQSNPKHLDGFAATSGQGHTDIIDNLKRIRSQR